MANSKFEYVKDFELDDRLLPHCWIVVRLDGKGFTKFTNEHGFEKPHDEQGLHLMNTAALGVVRDFPDVRIAFGESDEFSFVLRKSATLYGRRASKIVSLITSSFTGHYVMNWSRFFPDRELVRNPMFDGRAVLYPSDQSLRDYLSWRQADTHINCQYNTCYWALVHEGKSREEAQGVLKGTLTADKNEILFTRGINYNDIPAMYRKGSIIIWDDVIICQNRQNGNVVEKKVKKPVVLHEDIIKEEFWIRHPDLLAS